MMRTFTFLSIAVTIAFSANAAILNRRAISTPVNECVGLFDNLETRLKALSNSFATYQERDKYIAYTPADISKIEQDHEKLLLDSTDALKALDETHEKCCPIPIPFTAEEDGKAVLGALERYSTAAINAFNTLNSAINKFDKSGDPYHEVVHTLSVSFTPINSFHECLVKRFPATDVETAQTSANKTYDSFLEVAKSFNADAAEDVPGYDENDVYGHHTHPEKGGY